MNIREIEHDRLLENLKTALKEYVDYAEYIKRANAATKKRSTMPDSASPAMWSANRLAKEVRRDQA